MVYHGGSQYQHTFINTICIKYRYFVHIFLSFAYFGPLQLQLQLQLQSQFSPHDSFDVIPVLRNISYLIALLRARGTRNFFLSLEKEKDTRIPHFDTDINL